MRDEGVDGIITNKPGELSGWETGMQMAGSAGGVARAGILAPVDGAQYKRGESFALSLDTGAAASADAMLDGRAIADGAIVRAADLDLGEHTVALSTTSGSGARRVAAARFTVVASLTGLSGVVAATKGVPNTLRPQLLGYVLAHQWGKVTGAVAEHDGELGETAAKLIGEEAAALAAAEGPGSDDPGTGTGPQGPKGEKGDQGEPGPAGTDGSDGATGPVGPAGSDGTNGTDGRDGAAGPVGPIGMTGPAGPKGDTGPRGANGRDAIVTCKVTGGSRQKVTCTVTFGARAAAASTTGRLVRNGRTYAKGRVKALKPTRKVKRGRYTLRVKQGRSVVATKVTVR